jgi:colicin import membrane protein
MQQQSPTNQEPQTKEEQGLPVEALKREIDDQRRLSASRLSARAVALLAESKKLKITDDLSRQMAVEIRNQLKSGAKEVKNLYEVWAKPLYDEWKLISETMKPISARFSQGVEIVDEEIKRDHREQECKAEQARLAAAAEQRRQQQEAERRAKEEADQRAREAAEKARQEAEEAGFTEAETKGYAAAVQQEEEAKPIEAMAPAPVLPAIAPPAKTVRTESGAKATVKKIPDFEVVDLVALVTAWPGAVEVKRGYVLGLYSKGVSVEGVRFFPRESVSG